MSPRLSSCLYVPPLPKWVSLPFLCTFRQFCLQLLSLESFSCVAMLNYLSLKKMVTSLIKIPFWVSQYCLRITAWGEGVINKSIGNHRTNVCSLHVWNKLLLEASRKPGDLCIHLPYNIWREICNRNRICPYSPASHLSPGRGPGDPWLPWILLATSHVTVL